LPDRGHAAGWAAARRAFLAGDASARRYERLTLADGRTAVLMDAPPGAGEDLAAFTRIARHLRSLGLSAPEILAEDEAAGFLLLEDLGDALFARLLDRAPQREAELYAAATDVLVRLQSAPPPPGLPLYDAAAMAEATAPAISHYRFALTGARSDPAPLTTAMHATLEALPPLAPVMIHRDYHAENLLWLPARAGLARTGLLDFQLAMLSHPAYDLVSLLQDARRDIAPATETAMIRRFIAARGFDPAGFRRAYAAIGAQRHLRILGIFARLALEQGKTGYLAHLPRVWRDLQRCLADPALATLAATVAGLLPAPSPDPIQSLADRCRSLTP
jgi:aminoglycoside/choline kinase family phosphotransferase